MFTIYVMENGERIEELESFSTLAEASKNCYQLHRVNILESFAVFNERMREMTVEECDQAELSAEADNYIEWDLDDPCHDLGMDY